MRARPKSKNHFAVLDEPEFTLSPSVLGQSPKPISFTPLTFASLGKSSSVSSVPSSSSSLSSSSLLLSVPRARASVEIADGSVTSSSSSSSSSTTALGTSTNWGSSPIDLKGVADELTESVVSRNSGGSITRRVFGSSSSSSSSSSATPTSTPFDFASFADATTVTEAEIARAAVEAAAATELEQMRAYQADQLKAMFDKERNEFKEKLSRLDLSRGQRSRKIKDADTSSSYNDRLGVKAMKRGAAKKRMNKAKNTF